MNTKTIEFIKKVKNVHGDKYNYDLVDYINSYTKITIFCETHGLFMQAPTKHLSGNNCPKCAHTITTEEFITKVNKVHNNRYNYLNTVFNGVVEKIEINCSTHGSFIQKAQSIHGNLYEYSKIPDIIKSKDKLCIICPKHGEFW